MHLHTCPNAVLHPIALHPWLSCHAQYWVSIATLEFVKGLRRLGTMFQDNGSDSITDCWMLQCVFWRTAPLHSTVYERGNKATVKGVNMQDGWLCSFLQCQNNFYLGGEFGMGQIVNSFQRNMCHCPSYPFCVLSVVGAVVIYHFFIIVVSINLSDISMTLAVPQFWSIIQSHAVVLVESIVQSHTIAHNKSNPALVLSMVYTRIGSRMEEMMLQRLNFRKIKLQIVMNCLGSG